MFSVQLENCQPQVTKPQLPAPSLCKCTRRNVQRQPNIAPICHEKWETHTKWSNYLIKKPGRSAIGEWSWQQPGLSHALFCHLRPQYKCKNVKTRGETEPRWVHSDAGHEPLTEDINYSAVTIALPVCKLMLSSNCTGPADCLTNFPEERLGSGLDSLDTQILALPCA